MCDNVGMLIVFIIVASVLAQFSAALWALYLIKITGRKRAWFLISLALFGMGIRRSITLFFIITGNEGQLPVMPYEVIGLVTSLCMLTGITWIAPLFISIKRAGMEKENLIGELQKALTEIKTLKGLLPICASCKKIRIDTEEWEPIELYIKRHSHADFTHGLCPECAKKLYPEVFFRNTDQ